jgi:hypothetical protein
MQSRACKIVTGLRVELVDFNVRLEPCADSRYRLVHYAAEFVNGDGEHVMLTRKSHVETRLLDEPYTAAWLLSHIIHDFTNEVRQGFSWPDETRRTIYRKPL